MIPYHLPKFSRHFIPRFSSIWSFLPFHHVYLNMIKYFFDFSKELSFCIFLFHKSHSSYKTYKWSSSLHLYYYYFFIFMVVPYHLPFSLPLSLFLSLFDFYGGPLPPFSLSIFIYFYFYGGPLSLSSLSFFFLDFYDSPLPPS